MTKISKPHDRLFKHSLQEKKIMQDWLQAHLPPATLELLELDTLSITPTEVIPKFKNPIFCDVVYNCRIKNQPGYIVVSAEHQSQPEKNMPFRILRYSVELMNNHLKQNNQNLPIVLPIVLYAGDESPYPYSMDIFDCFENPELAKELALKNAQIIDLTVTPEERLEKSGSAGLLEFLLREYYKKQEGPLFFERSAKLLATARHAVGVEYIMEPFLYIVTVLKISGTPQEIQAKLKTLTKYMPEMEDKFMTIAQQLRQEGRQEGELKKAYEMVTRMLQDNMPVDSISRISGLSEEEVAKLRKGQAN